MTPLDETVALADFKVVLILLLLPERPCVVLSGGHRPAQFPECVPGALSGL